MNLIGYGFTEGGLSLQPLVMTSCSAAGDSVCKQTLGQPNAKAMKVVLLLGEDPAIKTSFKDALINYIFNVQVHDAHRLILVDDHVFKDATDVLRAYIFYLDEQRTIPFNLVLIEIPPLGSVGETERDVGLLKKLEEFLLVEFGESLVDGVNLITSTSISTSCSEYPLALANTYQLLGLCFENLENITQVLLSDSAFQASYLNVIKSGNIRYRNVFIIEDEEDALSDLSPEEQFFTQIFRHFDFHGISDFFQELGDMTPQRMCLANRQERGGLDIMGISRYRVIREFTEIIQNYEGCLELRRLLMMSQFRDEANRMEHLTLGHPHDKKTSRVILLVGDSGSGKTTLATSIVNHIFGARFHDRYRLLLDGDPLGRLGKDQNIRKTRSTSVYTFHHLPPPYDHLSLSIVDTPGLKNSEDQTYYKNFLHRLATLQQAIGIKSFDVICFVATAETTKLPDSYRFVNRFLNSMLPEGNGEIFVLATRSDAKRPPVVEALKNLGLPCSKVFKFNSHSLLTEVDDDGDDTHQALCERYWDIEQLSLTCFLAEVQRSGGRQ